MASQLNNNSFSNYDYLKNIVENDPNSVFIDCSTCKENNNPSSVMVIPMTEASKIYDKAFIDTNNRILNMCCECYKRRYHL